MSECRELSAMHKSLCRIAAFRDSGIDAPEPAGSTAFPGAAQCAMVPCLEARSRDPAPSTTRNLVKRGILRLKLKDFPRSKQVCASQTRTVSSTDPVTTRVPSGLHSALVTGLV